MLLQHREMENVVLLLETEKTGGCASEVKPSLLAHVRSPKSQILGSCGARFGVLHYPRSHCQPVWMG